MEPGLKKKLDLRASVCSKNKGGGGGGGRPLPGSATDKKLDWWRLPPFIIVVILSLHTYNRNIFYSVECSDRRE